MPKKTRITFNIQELIALQDRVESGWECADDPEPRAFWTALLDKIDAALVRTTGKATHPYPVEE